MPAIDVTPLGFFRQRLAQIKEEIDSNTVAVLGPVNTGADSVVGQYNGIIANAIDEIGEAIEDVYFSMYPASANGTSLDGAVSFVGIERLEATHTQVIAVCYGDDSTLIPSGSIASTQNNIQYRSQADVVISRGSVADASISVSDVQSSELYQVVFGPYSLQYTSGPSDTASDILNGLAAGATQIIAKVEGDKLRVTTANKQQGFSLATSQNLQVDEFGSPVFFVADNIGRNPLPIGALNKIVTSVSGWSRIENLASANAGRNPETDEELRARHALGVRAVGSATTKAIRARLLQEVDGVTVARVYENRNRDPLPDGMPANSFEAVVLGGLDALVAAKIWEVKPAGIEPYGNQVQYIQDENGDTQVVRFSRPVPRYIWVKIAGTRYDEETLPNEYKRAIRNAVLAYGESLEIGEDVLTQRFYGPIFRSVDGISTLDVQVAVTDTEGGTPAYSTANIPIGRSALATLSLARIAVEDF